MRNKRKQANNTFNAARASLPYIFTMSYNVRFAAQKRQSIQGETNGPHHSMRVAQDFYLNDLATGSQERFSGCGPRLRQNTATAATNRLAMVYWAGLELSRA